LSFLTPRKIEYSLIPIAIGITLLLVFSTSIANSYSQNTTTINITGQGIIWGGPNTYVKSTYRFDVSGPVFVKPGQTIELIDSTTDPHTLTLITSSVEPHSGAAVDECLGGQLVCGPAEAAGGGSSSNYVVSGKPVGSTYQCTSLATACVLKTSFSSTTTPNGDEVLIVPGSTLYLTIRPGATPGAIIHFMCVIHPWMQGEFIIS
jgi:hypothetical protein